MKAIAKRSALQCYNFMITPVNLPFFTGCKNGLWFIRRSLTDKWCRMHVLSTEYSIHYPYPLTILTSVSSSSSSSAPFLWNTSELGVSSTTPTPSSAIPVGNFNLLSNPSSSAGISSGARYRSSGFLHRCELKWRSLLNFWLQVWQIRLPCSSINCNK